MSSDSGMLTTLIALVTTQYAAYALSWLLCAAMMREERSVMLHWAGFMAAAGCGFSLNSQRGAEPDWWPYVGSNLAFLIGSMLLWRGGALFLRARGLEREQVVTLSIAFAGEIAIGSSTEMAPWRVLWTYGFLAWIQMRTTLSLLSASVSRFGWRVVAWIFLPMGLLLAGIVAAIVAQLSDMNHARTAMITSRSTGQLLVYHLAAASFNLVFMSISLGSLLGRLRRLASHDPLTDLANRRTLEQALALEWERWQRHATPFSVSVLDIDHFKRINDRYGHGGGDRVLAAAARRLRRQARKVDVVARWGGEEFVVLMPATAEEDAGVAAERQRQVLANGPIALDDEAVPVTISVGVATVNTGDADVGAVIARADAALYQAKADGRDRVVRFAEPAAL